MHAFRSHTCAELTEANVGQPVRLSGWVNRKRDHGQLVFVDLRDHYGLTQCVVDSSDPTFAAVEATRLESVVTITGTVLKRSDDTINTSLPTGHIEVRIEEFSVQSAADTLPLQVNSDEDALNDQIILKPSRDSTDSDQVRGTLSLKHTHSFDTQGCLDEN